MTEEIKFPHPVTEYDRIFVSRHGQKNWAVFGRVYKDANGIAVIPGGDHSVASYSDDVLCGTYDPNRVEALFDKVMQLKELAHAMRGD